MNQLKYENQLRNIFTNINEWLKFAEAKNFGLLTISAAFIFGLTQIDFPEDSKVAFAAYCVFIPFAVLSIVVCLISLFPILTKIKNGKWTKSWIDRFSNFIDKENKFENIHFYGYLRDIKEEEFEREFLQKTNSAEAFTDYERELVAQIIYNSGIAWLKYQLFKIAAFIFGLGLILSVLFYVILCICSIF